MERRRCNLRGYRNRTQPGGQAVRRTAPWRGGSRAGRRRSRREQGKLKDRPEWSALDGYARLKIQEWIQELLKEEITELLGRRKSERRAAVDGPAGYRNGYGTPRQVSMMAGGIVIRRPRVKGLEERFENAAR